MLDLKICRKTLARDGDLINSKRKILPCHLLFPTCTRNLTIILARGTARDLSSAAMALIITSGKEQKQDSWCKEVNQERIHLLITFLIALTECLTKDTRSRKGMFGSHSLMIESTMAEKVGNRSVTQVVILQPVRKQRGEGRCSSVLCFFSLVRNS